MADNNRHYFGWIPDYPDIRDYTEDHEKVKPLLLAMKLAKDEVLPTSMDLRKWCSPIENQLNLGSCTANAVASVVEYSEIKANGKYLDASRLFLYKVTRNLMQTTGDSGAFIKSALGALVLFGMPPEEYWPYDVTKFEVDPTPFCYAFAQNYKCINYFRHDPPGTSPSSALDSVKHYLANGIPSVFGFTVYQTISAANRTGKIPFPGRNEKVLGGHAIAAVGFDDNIVFPDGNAGALLIRNSWGTDWGEKGYGWLPYNYVLKGLAQDFWSVIKQDWVDSNIFYDPNRDSE